MDEVSESFEFASLTARTPTYQSPIMADCMLEHRVALVLSNRGIPDLHRLRIEVRNGTVVLRGPARTPFQKRMIVASAKSVKGVLGVVDEIETLSIQRIEALRERRRPRYVMSGTFAVALMAMVLVMAFMPREARLPVFPVQGRLLLNNLATPGAQVVFHLQNAGPDTPRPSGIVDKSGNFLLTTYETGDGAPLGNYVITVRWQKITGKGEDARTVEVIPPEYRSPITTKLKASITEVQNRVQLSLGPSLKHGRR